MFACYKQTHSGVLGLSKHERTEGFSIRKTLRGIRHTHRRAERFHRGQTLFIRLTATEKLNQMTPACVQNETLAH